MPLTGFQLEIVKLLSSNRSAGSHLAGGAALHFSADSFRYSNDLDYFHDSVELVSQSSKKDIELLKAEGFSVNILLEKEGFVRCELAKNKQETKIEWVHDSDWRFMPPQYADGKGYLLHPIDIAVNKLLALVGRDEPRDFLDILYIDKRILPLKALIWAAVGKDPGFSPTSLLEIVQRRGKYRQEDFEKLMLAEKVDLIKLKESWFQALEGVREFFNCRNLENVGCLYYSKTISNFIAPNIGDSDLSSDIVVHFGKRGGHLP